MNRRMFLAMCSILGLTLPVVGNITEIPKSSKRKNIFIRRVMYKKDEEGNESLDLVPYDPTKETTYIQGRPSFGYEWEFYEVFRGDNKIGELRMTHPFNKGKGFFGTGSHYIMDKYETVQYHSEMLDEYIDINCWMDRNISTEDPLKLANIGVRMEIKKAKEVLKRITKHFSEN